MTKADQRAMVFRRLHESSTAPVFWSEDDVNTALDAGYAELADATEWHEETVTIDLLNDRPYYDMRTVVGDRFLALGQAYHEDTNRWMVPTAVRQLDGGDRRWERVTGFPQRILVRGLWWLGLWPRTQEDGGTLRQDIVTLPDALEDDEEPDFPVAFHHGPVEWALSDLWAQDGESGRALAAWDAYLAVEAALTLWVNGRTSRPRRYGA